MALPSGEDFKPIVNALDYFCSPPSPESSQISSDDLERSHSCHSATVRCSSTTTLMSSPYIVK
ncbi:hypothetical protein [Chroococcidiopsis sp. TS-821]|uniref:hypothetical protein n=1 Tax=Chroococcidiopsis sp. TS-821 TaxID=1378066 RepID=UPI0011AFE25B|nr:hypothetical protein [Chroococcidiopsis sp. TS-821]